MGRERVAFPPPGSSVRPPLVTLFLLQLLLQLSVVLPKSPAVAVLLVVVLLLGVS